MKIIVAIKQVPEDRSQLRIDTTGQDIEAMDLSFALNESDAYALEEALRLKAVHNGEVIALSIGPERVTATLREALAKGADRAIHVLCDDSATHDALYTAQILARIIPSEAHDLILTGMQSDDLGWGQTGALLAELLDLPHSTMVLQIEKNESTIRARRELESGWSQYVELPTPCVLSIHSGGNKLRYATLMGIRNAKNKELRQILISELKIPIKHTTQLQKLTLPQKKKFCETLSGSAQEIAATLLEKLHNEAHIL